MKKFVLLLLGIFLLFGVAACNTGGSEIDIDMDEFIASPTNLAISGKVLSWDAVENADGYIVYVNGEEEDDVKTNSFDFSGLTEAKLVFQVRTKAPRGMQDSGLSASIAYVANPTAEIALINSAIEDSNMSLPEGFAEELVAKGMIGTEFEDMMDEVETFVTAVQSAETVTEFYNAVDQLLASVDNVEALVSAVIKTLLVEQIEMIIAENIDDLDYYQEWYDEEPAGYYKDYLGERVDSLEQEIAALQELLDQIENNPDYLVKSVTTTIEYFLSIEEMISTDLVGYIQNLSEVTDPANINVNELVLIKEEIVNILRETMPTQEDMVLMFEIYNTLMAVSGEVIEMETTVDNYVGKMAAQSLMTIEAFINFLDSLDSDYFTAVKAEFTVTSPNLLNGAEVIILTIKYYDAFREDNAALLDQISSVFTDEEQEQLFDDYMTGMSELQSDEEYNMFVSQLVSINFELLIRLQNEFEEAFDAALDAFVERDGEILRQMVILQAFEYDYWGDYYGNWVTGEVYENSSEYNTARTITEMTIAQEVFYMIDAVLNVTDNEDYQTVIELIFDVIFDAIPADEIASQTGIELTVINSLLTLAETTMNETSADQLELLQNIVEYAVDEEVFATVIQLIEDMGDYESTTYGEDYYYYDDPYLDYALLIVLAEIYDDFMTSGNRGLVDDIIAEFISALTDTNVQDLTGLTEQQVGFVETNLDDLLDFVKDELGNIANMNASDLSESDLTAIEDFINEVRMKAMYLTVDPDNTKG